MRVCVFVLTCALGTVSLASAQSLADVARKEGERRQDAKPASKTYTNTDLKSVRGASTDAAPADDTNASAAGDANGAAASDDQNRQAAAAGAEATPDQDAAADKDGDSADSSRPDAAGDTDSDAAASTEVADADADSTAGGGSGKADPQSEQYWSDRISRLRSQLERNETYLNALQSRVNSLTTDFVNRDDPAQRTQISNERQKALAELQRLEKQIQADRKAIPELEEEARRAGVPAGWLR